MHRFIYISTGGKPPEHERVCATAGHDMHSDKYVDGAWEPKQ